MSNNANNGPERAAPRHELHISAYLCHDCGRCVAVCPQGVLADDRGQVLVAHPELCDACLACEEACPEGAIEVSFAIVWADPLAQETDQA